MEKTTQLPTFAEIADMRCQEAPNGTKTINVKVAINTARMMVEAEIQERKNYRLLVQEVKTLASKYEKLWVEHCEKVGYASHFSPIPTTEARQLLRNIGESK